jgi:hypothetical protein
MLAFLFYNKSLISKTVEGVSVFMSLLLLIYFQTLHFGIVNYCVLALFYISAFLYISVHYAFICPSKKISCVLLFVLSIEFIHVVEYNSYGQSLVHNCTLSLMTYRIVADGFLFVLCVSYFGLRVFENMSDVESHLKIQQNLVRNMSHEMRTPLGVVRMSIENVRTAILCKIIIV